MAYSDISLLAADQDFANRTAACAATEHVADPWQWVNYHRWAMAATPGFGDQYASALAAEVERPGWDPAVISDAEILSAVQTIGTS